MCGCGLVVVFWLRGRCLLLFVVVVGCCWFVVGSLLVVVCCGWLLFVVVWLWFGCRLVVVVPLFNVVRCRSVFVVVGGCCSLVFVVVRCCLLLFVVGGYLLPCAGVVCCSRLFVYACWWLFVVVRCFCLLLCGFGQC